MTDLKVPPLHIRVHVSQLYEVDAESYGNAVACIARLDGPCAGALAQVVSSVISASCLLQCEYLWAVGSADEVCDTASTECLMSSMVDRLSRSACA